MSKYLYGFQNHLLTFSFLNQLSLLYTSDLHTQVNVCQHLSQQRFSSRFMEMQTKEFNIFIMFC
jgi:hypothetical protein